MSDSDYKTLTEAQALVLFVVWLARNKTKSGLPLNGRNPEAVAGLTNFQIREAVAKYYVGSGKPRGYSLPNIKIYIKHLVQWKPTPLLVPMARAGKEAIVYSLAREQLVRRSPIASMLLHLEDDYDGPIQSASFQREIEQKQMKNSDGTDFSGEKIDEALSICKKPPYPYLTEDTDGYLTTTDRVGRERRFLELIRYREVGVELKTE